MKGFSYKMDVFCAGKDDKIQRNWNRLLLDKLTDEIDVGARFGVQVIQPFALLVIEVEVKTENKSVPFSPSFFGSC